MLMTNEKHRLDIFEVQPSRYFGHVRSFSLRLGASSIPKARAQPSRHFLHVRSTSLRRNTEWMILARKLQVSCSTLSTWTASKSASTHLENLPIDDS